VTIHIMSNKELTRLEVLRDLTSGRLTGSTAAELLGLERRQVQRLAKAYRLSGADGLISKRRGRVSNRKTPEDLRLAAMTIIKDRYADFRPTLAAEKLREQHGLIISRETLRGWVTAGGLWLERKKRRGRVYQPRYRLISGHHQGQRRQRQHQQAGQRTAPWQIQITQITPCRAAGIHR
jgi:hypothetical protein